MIYQWWLQQSRRKTCITVNFWSSARISRTAAEPPPWRAERARGGAGGAAREGPSPIQDIRADPLHFMLM
eukprot:9494798-Pyramimonas_sp.AAC.1